MKIKKSKSVFLGLSILLLLILSGCKVDLFNELSEKQANRVLNVLQSRGIEAEKQLVDKRKGYYGIEVNRSDAARAISILNKLDIPSQSHPGYELVTKKSGILPNPGNKINRYYIALAGELSRTMESLPGVHFARIHFAIPQSNGNFGLDKKQAAPHKASVVLKVNKDQFQMKPVDVQTLVAGSIDQLEPQNVSIIIQIASLAKTEGSFYSSLGPFVVSTSTRTYLIILFSFLLLTISILAFFLIRMNKKLKKLV